MTKESDDKLFIYKIDKVKFFEVSSSDEFATRLDELYYKILIANEYIIGFDTQVYPGFATLFGLNPKLLDYNFQEQINELNSRVLSYSIKNIHSSIKQYIGYIDSITKEQSIMDMPKNVSITGDKTLMPNYFI